MGCYFAQHAVICSLCGIFKLGSSAMASTSGFIKVPPVGDTQPYAVANAFLAQFTVTFDGQWNCCHSCSLGKKPNTAYAVFMSPSYQRSLLNCSAFQQQLLSVLDCRVDFPFVPNLEGRPTMFCRLPPVNVTTWVPETLEISTTLAWS